MSKNILTEHEFSVLAINEALAAAGTDKILTEVDTGGATNGTLILTVLNNASSDAMSLVEVWTSSASDFATSGTALAAVASDGTARVLIASDVQGLNLLFAKGTTRGSISDLTVSSNTITKIDQDGMYVISCPNVSKYLNVQYTSAGTTATCSAVFIGHNVAEAPYNGARTAY